MKHMYFVVAVSLFVYPETVLAVVDAPPQNAIETMQTSASTETRFELVYTIQANTQPDEQRLLSIDSKYHSRFSNSNSIRSYSIAMLEKRVAVIERRTYWGLSVSEVNVYIWKNNQWEHCTGVQCCAAPDRLPEFFPDMICLDGRSLNILSKNRHTLFSLKLEE